MSGVQVGGAGGTVSVLGTQLLPTNGPVGQVTHKALALTGFASGTYLLCALVLIIVGVALRHWGTQTEA